MFERNIEQKEEWTAINNDPVFAIILSDCNSIRIAELVARRKDLLPATVDSEDEAEDGELNEVAARVEHDGEDEQFIDDSHDETSSVDFQTEFVNIQPLPQILETREQQRERQARPPEDVLETEEQRLQRLAREQEDRLTALGVTGFAKPVQPSVLRSVAVTELPQDLMSAETGTPSYRSRSASRDHR